MRNIDQRDPIWEAEIAFFTTQVCLTHGCTVLCACSGGTDSVCLLHSLLQVGKTLGFRVIAAHYNHNLRGEESQRDADFVRTLAEDLGVEIIFGEGDVAAQAGEHSSGIEETAREMRYTFLRQAAQGCGAQFIATAHNANDNAETVLMRLLRGTGTRGLAGIPPIRGNIIRPLLTVFRKDIEEYLARYKLPHVEDSSNSEDVYTRNRIRHQLLPVLEELSPGIVGRLNHTAEYLRMDENYLTSAAEKLAAQARRDGDRLYIPSELLVQSGQAVAVRAIRILLAELREGNDNCTSVHFRNILELCRGEKSSGELHIPGGILVLREYENLVLTPRRVPPLAGCYSLPMPGEITVGRYHISGQECRYLGEVQGPYHFFLDGRCGEMIVRGRRTGDELCRPGRKRKTLKKLFIDEKIPLQNRDALPIFEYSDRIAAVAGLGPDMEFVPEMGELSWEIIITTSES